MVQGAQGRRMPNNGGWSSSTAAEGMDKHPTSSPLPLDWSLCGGDSFGSGGRARAEAVAAGANGQARRQPRACAEAVAAATGEAEAAASRAGGGEHGAAGVLLRLHPGVPRPVPAAARRRVCRLPPGVAPRGGGIAPRRRRPLRRLLCRVDAPPPQLPRAAAVVPHQRMRLSLMVQSIDHEG
uniref:DUF834 domain-containing protein n=1 Tax=Oryza glumipatula TaxID=40148 RepID=A0A0E0BBA9_9ORYZ